MLPSLFLTVSGSGRACAGTDGWPFCAGRAGHKSVRSAGRRGGAPSLAGPLPLASDPHGAHHHLILCRGGWTVRGEGGRAAGRSMGALNSTCLTHQIGPLAPQQIGGRDERPGLSGRTPRRDGRECPQSHPGPTLSLVPVGMWEFCGAECLLSESVLRISADPHLPVDSKSTSHAQGDKGRPLPRVSVQSAAARWLSSASMLSRGPRRGAGHEHARLRAER